METVRNKKKRFFEPNWLVGWQQQEVKSGREIRKIQGERPLIYFVLSRPPIQFVNRYGKIGSEHFLSSGSAIHNFGSLFIFENHRIENLKL